MKAEDAQLGRRDDVLLVSDHHVGLGHHVRFRALARAAAADGLRVSWIIGSPYPAELAPPRGVDATAMPPVFRHGRPLEDLHELRRRIDLRSRILLDGLAASRPRILVTETYPFGRFILSAELIATLRAAREARPRPLVASSLRDLPVLSSDPGRRGEQLLDVASLLVEFYDAVLWHADPTVVGRSEPLADFHTPRPVFATGYVESEEPVEATAAERSGSLLVFAGSGAVGYDLLAQTLEASRLGLLGPAPLEVVAGPRMRPAEVAKLRDLARVRGAVFHEAVPEMRSLLRRCRAAICQSGYNSALDLVATGTRAVVVPYRRSGDQPERAAFLERLGWVVVLDEEALCPAALGRAVGALLECTRAPRAFDRDGAARTVTLWREWISGNAPC